MMRYTFSRKGSCTSCGGSGAIWKYRHTNNGRCYHCNGTGGVCPPKGCYKVFYNKDIFLGYVQRVQHKWRAIPVKQRELVDTVFSTREAAADWLITLPS